MTKTLEDSLEALCDVNKAANIFREKYGTHAQAEATKCYKKSKDSQDADNLVFWREVVQALSIH